MANGKKSDIGTDKYFEEISAGTVFDSLRMAGSDRGFADRLKEIGENASRALEEIYSDLEKNKTTIQFMESREKEEVESLADSLYDIAHFVSVSTRKSANDISSKLKSFASPSKYSTREVQHVADELKKGVRFNQAPYKRIDNELLEAAMAYNQLDKYTPSMGKNGKALGTREYSEQMVRFVFGDSFSHSFGFNSSYKDMIKKQIEEILDEIKSDVRSEQGTDKYVEYDERKRIMKIAAELSKYCSGSSDYWLQSELEKLRRLEDRNNKVIEIDRTGGSYPVEAELKWENGKNILTLTAKVYFERKILKPIKPDRIPRPPVLSPYAPSPEPGPAPDWNPEMEAELRAAREEAYAEWQRAYNEAEREYDAALKEAQRKVDDDFEKRKDAAIREFESWEKTTPYTVFNGQKVYVEVEINEISSSWDNAITIFFDSPTDASMSWGGVTGGITSWKPNLFDTVTRLLDWKPNTPKVMFLKESHFPDDSFGGIARHEFGHSLGLGDAYNASYIPFLYRDFENNTVAESRIPGFPNIAMNNNAGATDIEIEMVILAFATGRRQNFRKQAYYQSISEALR